MNLARWNDDRLDDLNRRVDGLIPLQGQVIKLTENFAALHDDIGDLNGSIGLLRTDLKDLRGDPVKDARQRRSAIISGTVAAVVGGAFTAIVTVAATGGFG